MTGTSIAPQRKRRRRALRPSALILMASLVLTAACGRLVPAGHGTGSVRVARQAAATRRDVLAGGHSRLSAVSASFVSASVGWLLAVPPCAHSVHPCQTVLLRRTADGGRTWVAAPAPPAPFSGQPGSAGRAVSAILFATSREGWAWGPGLWETRDGSATWRRVSIQGGPVRSVAAGDGRVLAATGRCGKSGPGQCRFQVYTSPAGSSDWRPVPGAAGRHADRASLVVSGQIGYVFTITQGPGAGLGKPVLLTGQVNGSARWQPLRIPCQSAWSMAVAAARGGWLFVGCGSEPGAGQQVKTAYVSGNDGRAWQRVASPPGGGYLGGASMTPGGTIFLSGGRMDVYISGDRGRGWHPSPSLDNAAGLAGAGFNLSAVATGDASGYAVQAGTYQHQIWVTDDGGRRWTPVTVR